MAFVVVGFFIDILAVKKMASDCREFVLAIFRQSLMPEFEAVAEPDERVDPLRIPVPFFGEMTKAGLQISHDLFVAQVVVESH